MTTMTLSARVVRDNGSAVRQGQRTRSCLRSAAWLLALLLGLANAQASSVATGAIFAHSFEAPTGPIAPGDITIEIASHWGGPIRGGDVQGDYAYIANGRMFRILDISDETNPVEVGALKLSAGTVAAAPGGLRDVKVRGEYAFVGGDNNHFFNVVDVSNPAAPSLVRSIARPDSNDPVAGQIELSGDYAYVLPTSHYLGSEGRGIQVYRINDPVNTVSLGFHSSDTVLTSMAIHNGHLFVGTSVSGREEYILIFDLSNPAVPVRVGALVEREFRDVRDLVIAGEHLYVTVRLHPSGGNGRYRLLTIDISNPTAPVLTDVQTGAGFSGGARQLAVSEGRLSLIQASAPGQWFSYQGLHIFDIAQTPEAPVLLDTYRSHGTYGAILAAAPGRTYLWDKASGFVIMDVADPSLPQPLGKFHSPSELRNMVADGSHVYVSDAYGGFTVLDLADTSHPRVLGSYLAKRHDVVGVNVIGIDKVDDIVYLAAGSSGLLTVDVSDPARPHTLGAMRISSMAFPSNPWCGAEFQGLKVRDNVVYLGYLAHFCNSAAMYLLAVDVTDPFAPAAVGVESVLASIISPVHSIAVGDGIVAAGGRMTLHADSPADPQLLHGPMFGSRIDGMDFAIHESLRLIVIPEQHGTLPSGVIHGLNIQDIGDPTNPTTISTLTIGESMHALAVHRDSDRVYLRSQRSMLAMDISDPATPVELHRLTGFQVPKGDLVSWPGLLADEPNLYATDALGLTVLNVQSSTSSDAGPPPN